MRRTRHEALRECVAAAPAGAEPDVSHLADQLQQAVPAISGLIFFGSHMTGAGANAHSALDLFVVVEDYARYYDALASAGWARHPRRLAALNRLLPPNITSLSLPKADAPGERWLAKGAVIRLERLEREASSRRRDHFCTGRLFQPAAIVFARDAAIRARLVELLARALAGTYDWVRPWLPESFDAEAFGRCLLRVSLAGEIRPENAARATQLWEAQSGLMLPRIERLLAALAEGGELRPLDAGRYALTRPVGRLESLRLRAYFARSKVRATLRWLKHTWTFEDWLEYLLRKVERHSGQRHELTERERAHPFIFLWPRFLRYLRHKEKGVSDGR